MSSYHVTYGLDVAMRHGSWIGIQWVVSDDKSRIICQHIISKRNWSNKEEHMTFGLKEHDHAKKILRATQSITDYLKSSTDYEQFPIGIDFTFNSFGRTSRLQHTLMAYFVGQIMFAFGEFYQPMIFSPRDVRKTLGLKANVPKVTIWPSVLQSIDINPVIKLELLEINNEDSMDAFVLAYCALIRRLNP